MATRPFSTYRMDVLRNIRRQFRDRLDMRAVRDDRQFAFIQYLFDEVNTEIARRKIAEREASDARSRDEDPPSTV